MCDPITIAGIALTGASTVANTIAANKRQKARDDALAAERIRQQGLDREAAALNETSQDRYVDFDEQQEERAGDLSRFFTGAEPEGADATAALDFLPASDSAITVREEGKQREAAKDFTDQQGEALADLRSFGDLFGGIGRDQARDASLIGQIGGFKRGSSSILPLELEDANSEGSGFNTLGDLFSLGGGLALNAGLGGASSRLSDPWYGFRNVGSTRPSGLVRLFGG